MGKCASKQQQQHRIHSNLNRRSRHHDYLKQHLFYARAKYNGHSVDTTVGLSISEQNIYRLIQNEGQTESKKRSRSVETKGTQMSFGFKKKIPIQKRNALSAGANKTNATNKCDASANSLNSDQTGCIGDNNGNSVESFDTLNDKNNGLSTPRLSPPRKDVTGAPIRSTRFGFRLNRPSSTSHKNASCDNVINNNVATNKINAKPRSKSACGSRRSLASSVASNESHPKQASVHFQLPPSTMQPKQNNNTGPKIENQAIDATNGNYTGKTNNNNINNNNNNNNNNNINSYANSRLNVEQQRRQFFMQSNPIQNSFNQNKPPIGKRSYTIINTELHTHEIVRSTPQAATTIVSKFTLHTSSLPKPQYPVISVVAPPVPIPSSSSSPPSRPAMDTKNAKQAANSSTRKGFQAQREISADSGIGSISSQTSADIRRSPQQRQRQRPRNLEMVFSGRNKFHVRDLSDATLSDDSVQPLALPKLPSACSSSNQPANLNGLIRANENELTVDRNVENASPRTITPANKILEEEKQQRDSSATEKMERRQMHLPLYTHLMRSSSTMNSVASASIGDAMASRVENSSSGSGSNSQPIENRIDLDDTDDISTLTLETDNKLCSISSCTLPSSDTDKQSIDDINEHCRNNKFAAITAALNDMLLDDETSPSDSLISSSASDDCGIKKAKKKINDSIKECANDKDLNDTSPIFEIASPISPHGTPTHATNSFSFSDGDGARDFLIDDEIADQPVLCFGDTHASNTQLQSIVDTPTLKEVSSLKSASNARQKAASDNNSLASLPAPLSKPIKSTVAKMSRTESLDTLSPCESISSDDLMMDFECNSSNTSSHIDVANQTDKPANRSNGLDEQQLWMEFEQNGGGQFKDWSYLLKTSRNKSQDISISQLPVQSTRLLNRSRFQQTTLDGTRSIENLSITNCKASSRPSSQRDSANGSPDDQLFMLDKTLRNSMIQDVQYCKQQLLQLRSILQENEEYLLMRTSSHNPLDIINGKFLDSSGAYDSQNNLACLDRDNYSPSLSDDPKHDLVDLRRQIVYLQSQLDDKDRTIRIQQDLIHKLEAEKNCGSPPRGTLDEQNIERTNMATQTDRVRPLSMNFDGSNSSWSDDEDMHLDNASNSLISSSSSSSSKFRINGIILNASESTSANSTTSTQRAHMFRHQPDVANTVMDRKLFYETNLQKANEKPLIKCTKSTPNLNRICIASNSDGQHNENGRLTNDMAAMSKHDKYCRNIVSTTKIHFENTNTVHDGNETNHRMQKTTPIKSVKMLNNLNVLKSRKYPETVKSVDE